MTGLRVAAVGGALLLGACSGVIGIEDTSTPRIGGTSPASAVTTAAPATGAATTVAVLADAELPTDCGPVTDPERLGRLGVETSPTTVFTPASATAMPTSEAEAQQEDRVWPGLSCLYASPDADQEAIVLVMPDTSPFFTTRQTTTCEPTWGKGSSVNLGGVRGWYCPTTNETPGEWVSFVHHGRLVTVNRTSTPSGGSPYKDALISYASWLATRV